MDYNRAIAKENITNEKLFFTSLPLFTTLLAKGGRTLFWLIIAGTRTFNDYAMLRAYCDMKLSRKIAEGEQIEIVSGACPTGADYLGEKYAAERGFSVRLFPADWQQYGRRAGAVRNRQMAQYGNALIAFWDGKSKGTKIMIDEARAAGIIVCVKTYTA